MNATLALRIGAIAAVAASVFGLAFWAWRVPIPARPRLGRRGVERRHALDAGGGFSLLEPLVRFLAGSLALLPLAKLREVQERELRQADHPLGLTPNELSGLSLVSAIALGVVMFGVGSYTSLSLFWALAATAFGLVLPTLQLREHIRRRAKEITRGLPHSIEIVAMCMGAGHDFPGALRLVADPQGGRQTALSRELHVILEHLELGHTRRDALKSFAERVPTDAVRDFVNAVTQAEEKGNPLAKVLQVQGRMLNMRRSVAAEEAAARAAVMLVGPMMILVCCVLLLLMGPFLVRGVGF